MKIEALPIHEALLITPEVYADNRGHMLEIYQEQSFEANGIHAKFVLDYYSYSKRNVIRGLHYQLGKDKMQEKLVKVINGEIFDVIVDMRWNSPTFGKWFGTILSDKNFRQVWIPSGIAHGFYVMSEWSDMLYKFTAPHNPEGERVLLWNDPDIGIEWPLINGQEPVLSSKDKNGKLLKQAIDKGNFI